MTPPNGFASLTVSCPETHPRVIGGGVDTSSDFQDFGLMEESYPNGTGGWSVRMRNNGGSFTLPSTVFAICVA